MTRYGYFLSSEENSPQELVRQARLAEEAGFDALWISDHYHPWLDEQGESSFVWSVIGAISHATSLPETTAVTCPLVRTHPAIVAQAAATSSLLASGRFTLGLGSWEALNEHISGRHGRAARRPATTSRESARTSTPDLTRCTSARSAPSTLASSSSTPARCCPACARREEVP
jgi:G6PDH family F420-dependent oxidoreductase